MNSIEIDFKSEKANNMTNKNECCNKCPTCNVEVVESVNEVYCPKCGLVIDDSPVDFGYDYDNWEGDEKFRARAGKASCYLDADKKKTLPTLI